MAQSVDLCAGLEVGKEAPIWKLVLSPNFLSPSFLPLPSLPLFFLLFPCLPLVSLPIPGVPLPRSSWGAWEHWVLAELADKRFLVYFLVENHGPGDGAIAYVFR